MKNYVQHGGTLDFTAPAGGVTAGVPLLIGAVLVVPAFSAVEGATFAATLTGVFTLPKATGAAWTEGSILYWDDAAKKVTTTSAGNTKIGLVAKAAASADTVGNVRLNGAV